MDAERGKGGMGLHETVSKKDWKGPTGPIQAREAGNWLSNEKTLKDAIDTYIERSGHKENTLKDDKKHFNQVINALRAKNHLRILEWSEGREKVLPVLLVTKVQLDNVFSMMVS